MHGVTAVWQWWVRYEDLLPALFLERTARFRVAAGGQLDRLVEDGEVWRLFTSVLLHGDALHLGVNLLALVALGRLVEPWWGKLRLFAWFTAGGVIGSVTSQLVGVRQSDGASGGLFALLGLVVIAGIRFRGALHPEDRRLLGPVLWVFLGLNVIASFALPFVDVAGHLGGLGAGLLFGLLAPRPGEDRWWRRLLWALWSVGFVAVVAWGWSVG